MTNFLQRKVVFSASVSEWKLMVKEWPQFPVGRVRAQKWKSFCRSQTNRSMRNYQLCSEHSGGGGTSCSKSKEDQLIRLRRKTPHHVTWLRRRTFSTLGINKPGSSVGFILVLIRFTVFYLIWSGSTDRSALFVVIEGVYRWPYRFKLWS